MVKLSRVFAAVFAGACIAGTVTLGTALPAVAEVRPATSQDVTWIYWKTYPSLAQCYAAGNSLPGGIPFRCVYLNSTRTELWVPIVT